MTGLAALGEPYTALAGVYDRWTDPNPYDRWVDFITARLAQAGIGSGARVLDVCCGTGSMAVRLRDRGYQVAGIDGSAAMLGVARDRLGPLVELHQVILPAELPFTPAVFDAAICCFDSVNYLPPSALQGFFATVASALRPGGLFVFDVNSRYKLEEVFGSSQYGDDQGDFAYVWRNRYDPTRGATDFLITLFTRADDGFRREEEQHRQWWFDHDTIRNSANRSGFTTVGATADYTSSEPEPDTLRETWVLRREEPAGRNHH
ncbi:class I SAM-dependent DNA methyltransferase [Plantactinospora soyae]|uniref:SAM-dependent methyltransferase n=1 Tax=Plantactinospora soyae TaxID=1544732 RepID=A0A927M9E7_9ACTN|nr:class I SAM-dependent methyltransferase [Plantactinospora soyae]MBE1489507.1 SAM-dependent methyltransferase [Plantactinospora soyae]